MSDAPLASDLLADEHIVVTGGGTGLGRAMAEQMAALGATITINGRRTEPLDETVAAIRDAGGTAAGISCNVREADAVRDFFDAAEERQGPVTGLVNNAAANFLAAAEDISPNGFDAIIKTNLYGTFYCTQQCGQRWLKREERGTVLSIATTYAETGSAFVLPSAMSKAGIVAMTKSLAAEWGHAGIRLNAVAPGPFPTKGAWSRLVPGDDMEQKMKSRVPLKRFGKPEELARLVAFLMSSANSYMNGEVVTFDGGEKLVAGGQFNDFTRMPRAQVKAMFEAMRSASD
ncbi:SDR family oxidoreductase [Salisaeta longa]|uniref:SDR family oxidoreductase n=1 Tax=Salisaeta longa TaxID=503170 RepID=UPI0003B64622|nr:SDR family oxidoreductase [Salisaeta longa]